MPITIICPQCRQPAETGTNGCSGQKRVAWHLRADDVPCEASGMKVAKIWEGGPTSRAERWAREHGHPDHVPPPPAPDPDACPTGKVSFDSEELADLEAVKLTRANLRRPRDEGRTGARAYQCDDCARWHLTSAPWRTSGVRA